MDNIEIELGGKKYHTETIREIMHNAKSWGELERFSTVEFLQQLDKKGLIPKAGDPLIRLVSRAIETHFFERTRHNCYWNDNFYLANRFDEDIHVKQTAAIVTLWNGRHNYFEWNTHYGFDNAKLLSDMGIITSSEATDFRSGYEKQKTQYTSLPKEIHDKIRERFKLKKEDLLAARWLCEGVKEKEDTNNAGSGRYGSLITTYEIG